MGGPPDGTTAKAYADSAEIESIPVTADGSNQVYEFTPWDGAARPGKCAVSPDMVLLACYAGEDDTEGFDAIRTHAAL